ncbi:MAG: class I SAM-dependent methyltransferase [Cyanophyceae cyanobacterium]
MSENSQFLKEIIVERIESALHQRISFAEYMDLVLYHPHYGYYASGAVQIGTQGDFFTSSSLGPDFAQLLAEQFVEMWQALSRPEPFTLIEMGAGSGLGAADILQYLQRYPELLKVLQYTIVESSPALIVQQQQVLKNFAVSWKTWSEIADDSIVGCCFSNELVDAFPVHRVIKGPQLEEIYVTTSPTGFREVKGKPSTPRLATYFELVGIDILSSRYPNGYRTEVNLAALDWLAAVAKKLARGYLLTIDYGYTAERYYSPQRDQGTLQCYTQHRRHNNPYVNLGTQDITAHVDFTALERQGERYGFTTVGSTKQGLFLMALGLGDRLAELASNRYSVSEIFQRRDALHQLIDPSGLGGFGVLIQSRGLSEHQLRGLTMP